MSVNFFNSAFQCGEANHKKARSFTPQQTSADFEHEPHLDVEGGQRNVIADKLSRQLSSRQVQMIAIGGTIGTGLFLGTGKSLATGEMAAYMPIAGSFCTYARSRFVDGSLGFALTWNYWFNDAVSTASDLVASQMVLKYWTDKFPGWALSLLLLVAIALLNVVNVRLYGELEYWLSLLKVVTIVIFIIIGVVVNCGANTDHAYIGGKYWHVVDAPFVGGIGGFASVFVTAAFSFGGTESIAITAGETKNPAKVMPKVVRNVFWRILFFYFLSVLIIGLDIPYNYPNLSTKDTGVSPFTLVFQSAGSHAAGSFVNAVITSSVISAGNHALFAGSRLLYTLAVDRHAPSFFGLLSPMGVPYVAVLATVAVSALCFGASYVGAGQLWAWLQNIVGVSNQISWLCIGITSVRFRRAIKRQGLEDLLPYRNWMYPIGPYASIFLNTVIILVQGWSCFSPTFRVVSFISLYIELPIMVIMMIGWKLFKRTKYVKLEEMDLSTDRYVCDIGGTISEDVESKIPWKGFGLRRKAKTAGMWIFI
ncbi:hypothetical protein KEM55_004144 [Ascosphaera atra]|nr:hypothetical protein KEM55_004144 [Ascosphaera atra]